MRNRLIWQSFLLEILSVFCFCPCFSGAEQYGDFTFTIQSKTIAISKYTGVGGAVTIPDKIEGLPVTSIEHAAFEGCTGLISITIPGSVTIIGVRAFAYCHNLASITIPGSVTCLGRGAFAQCRNLAGITIPGSLTCIEDSTFEECKSLTHITIPNNVTTIGNGAFQVCCSLRSITIPNSITHIGDCAFRDCNSLTNITIPGSVTSIGWSAFSGCSGLTTITIPRNVTDLKPNAFIPCSRLTGLIVEKDNPNYSSMDGVLFNKKLDLIVYYPTGRKGEYTIPENVTSIGDAAFRLCRGLIGLTIPDRVTLIGSCAFEDCSVTSISIPKSVTSIEYAAFRFCQNLAGITVDEGNPNYSSLDGVLFDKKKSLVICYPAGKAGAHTISGSVKEIGTYAFYSCRGLTHITIPNSVTIIGRSAFEDCILARITIPSSVTIIRDRAFYGCSSLTSITIPNNVAMIGNSVFEYCSSLTEAYFLGPPPRFDSVSGSWSSVFRHCATPFTIYYNRDYTDTYTTYGWETPEWKGYPAFPYTEEPVAVDDWQQY